MLPWGTSNLGALPTMPGLAEVLLGDDPRELHNIERIMDAANQGPQNTRLFGWTRDQSRARMHDGW